MITIVDNTPRTQNFISNSVTNKILTTHLSSTFITRTAETMTSGMVLIQYHYSKKFFKINASFNSYISLHFRSCCINDCIRSTKYWWRIYNWNKHRTKLLTHYTCYYRCYISNKEKIHQSKKEGGRYEIILE